MKVAVCIRPGLAPVDRSEVELDLAEAIERALGVEIEGVDGGTLTAADGTLSESDFDFELPDGTDAAEVERVCTTVLRGIGFRVPTKIHVTVGEHKFSIS